MEGYDEKLVLKSRNKKQSKSGEWTAIVVRVDCDDSDMSLLKNKFRYATNRFKRCSLRMPKLSNASNSFNHYKSFHTSERVSPQSSNRSAPDMECAESVWQSMLSCAVCGKEVDKSDCPQLSPCCHSACKACVADEVAAQRESLSKEKALVVCGVCSQPFSPVDCVDNVFVINYIDNRSDKSSPKHDEICSQCEGENKSAFIKCDRCDWICKECFEAHTKMKVFKDHELDGSTKVKEQLTCDITHCVTHNKSRKLYCETCKRAECTNCMISHHNGHEVSDSDKIESNAKQFSGDVSKLMAQISEKRGLIENTLKSLETIETDISTQKEESKESIKSITKKLQEKISDLANSMLDQVDSACQRKENDYNEKKAQLVKLNESFLHVERFIKLILEQNVSIAIVMAKEIFKKQLLYLLNKPCTQPNYVKPFSISVIDELSGEKQEFSVEKMVEGVFKMCFKIKTSDDVEDNSLTIGLPDASEVDEVEIITPVTAVTANTNTVNTNAVRGNSEPPAYISPPYNRSSCHNANRLQSQCLPSPTQMRDTSRLIPNHANGGSAQTMHSLSQMANNISHVNNNVPQTGVQNTNVAASPLPMYCQPQLYISQASNQMMPNCVAVNSIPNQTQPVAQNAMYPRYQSYNMNMNANPPNITIRNTASIGLISSANAPIQPMPPMQQTPFVQNIRVMAGGTITASTHLPQTTRPSLQTYSSMATPISLNNNQLLIHHLSTTPQVTSVNRDPRISSQYTSPQNNLPFVDSTPRPAPQPITSTRSANPTQINTNRNPSNYGTTRPTILMPFKVPQNSAPINSLKNCRPLAPKKPTTPTTPNIQQKTAPKTESRPLSTSTEQLSNAVNSVKESDAKAAECATSASTETANSPRSMPTLASMIGDLQTNPPQSTNEITKSAEIASETIAESNASENTTSGDNNNKDENKENKDLSTRSAAPIARIAPITPNAEVNLDLDMESDEDIEETEGCAICRENGELILCFKCLRAFHIQCHIPVLDTQDTSASTVQFNCTFCKVKSLQHLSESSPNERLQAIFERILIDLFCHKNGSHFLKPFTECLINNNTSRIENPIDFRIIKKRLEEKKYKEEEQYIADVKLVFDNFYRQIDITFEAIEDCKKVESHFKQLVDKFLPKYSESIRLKESTKQSSASEPKRARLS